jgi:beta-phosphoglucomutase
MAEKMKRNFRAVIFDMDGVITNTMPYHFDAWLATFKRAGIAVNCYDVYKREGQDGLTSVREIFRERKLKLNLPTARRILAEKEALFKHIVKIKFVKGARPFVRALKKRGFSLALVTGTSRHETEKILPQKLRALFDVTVTGDEVKKGKPNPEPFFKALKLLKMDSGSAVVLENAPFGVKAAKKAGLFCIALETSLPREYLTGADIIFKSYDELSRYFLVYTSQDL